MKMGQVSMGFTKRLRRRCWKAVNDSLCRDPSQRNAFRRSTFCTASMTLVAWWVTAPSLLLGEVAMALAQDLIPHTIPHARVSWSSPGYPLWGRGFASVSRGPISGRKVNLEGLWRKFFSDPSQWSDHRLEKANPHYPDFKNKKTKQSLWLDNRFTPPWVETKLAAIAPGTLQSTSFAWNVRLQKCVKAGEYKKAMKLFQQMQQEGIIADKFTFVPVLNACSGLVHLEEGRRIHLQIIKSGFECDVVVGNSLVDMYGKCGRIEDARKVFNKMPARDVVSWNSLILGHVKGGQGQEALELFQRMQQEVADLSAITFIAVLNACASIGALEEGRCVHQQIIDKGYECDLYVANSLVDMYAKCGSIEDAQIVFNKMPTRNVVSWSALILGYVNHGQGHNALIFSQQMQQAGLELDSITFVAVLNACASIGALEQGRHIHQQIIDKGYESNAYVANSLVDMYVKCGSLEDAWKVFNKMPTRDVVSWGVLIHGYVKRGEGKEALGLFHQMQREGVALDPVTFVGVLNACASIGALEEGRCAHKQIIDRGYECDVSVASSLVDMYAKCRSMEDARRMFNKMPTRNAASWNSLITAYVKCGQMQEARELSKQMDLKRVDLDPVTLVSLLTAYASMGALEEGRRAHQQIIDRGYENDVYVTTSLVDMYVKCGCIEEAQRVFDKMQTRDRVSWSAMLAGYCKYGYSKEALGHFEQMCQEVKVDAVSFISLLSACSHSGLVDEGMCYFESMIAVHNISPTLEHYTCIIDLIGRAGHLHEAEDLIRGLPYESDAPVWRSLLGACTIHGNVEMGERVAKRVLVLDPGSPSGYVMLSNIFAAAGKWDSE